MPSGLQVWDAAGNLTLDTTMLIGRILGSSPVAAGQLSGTISHPAFSTGTPFGIPFVGFSTTGMDISPSLSLPIISFAGGSLSWTRAAVGGSSSSEGLPAGVIYYGVY